MGIPNTCDSQYETDFSEYNCDGCDYPNFKDCAYECGGSAVVDECGECGGSGPAENYDCDGNCIDGGVEDCSGVCGGSAELDQCGICGGPGAIYECGCADIPEGFCDCNGNVEDECGICGGPGAEYECWDETLECSEEDCPASPSPQTVNITTDENTPVDITLSCGSDEVLYEIISNPTNGTIEFPEGEINPGDIIFYQGSVCCTIWDFTIDGNFQDCGYSTINPTNVSLASQCCGLNYFYDIYQNDMIGNPTPTPVENPFASNPVGTFYQCGPPPPTEGNTFKYTPNLFYNGPDTFTYKCRNKEEAYYNENISADFITETATGVWTPYSGGDWAFNDGDFPGTGTVNITVTSEANYPVILPIQLNSFHHTYSTTSSTWGSLDSKLQWLGTDATIKYYYFGDFDDIGSCSSLNDQYDCFVSDNEWDMEYVGLDDENTITFTNVATDYDLPNITDANPWPFVHTQGTIYRTEGGVVIQDTNASLPIATLYLPEDMNKCLENPFEAVECTGTDIICDFQSTAQCNDTPSCSWDGGFIGCSGPSFTCQEAFEYYGTCGFGCSTENKYCGGYTSYTQGLIDSDNIANFECSSDGSCMNSSTSNRIPGQFVLRGYSQISHVATTYTTFEVEVSDSNISISCDTGDMPIDHYIVPYAFYWGIPIIDEPGLNQALTAEIAPGGPFMVAGSNYGVNANTPSDYYIEEGNFNSGPTTGFTDLMSIKTTVCQVSLLTDDYNTANSEPALVTITYSDPEGDDLTQEAQFYIEIVPSDDVGTISNTAPGTDTLYLPETALESGFYKSDGLIYPPGTNSNIAVDDNSNYSSYYYSFEFTITDFDTTFDTSNPICEQDSNGTILQDTACIKITEGASDPVDIFYYSLELVSAVENAI
ncbi:MAG: hypothetical protein H8D94_00095, partial [Candidatus Pelagibacter sp.]|nr:hypothetical protein [Candidatus Pelagibacter sp.]